MERFTADQKVAMLVVPIMLFGMLGVSYAPAYGRTLTEEEEVTVRRGDTEGGDEKQGGGTNGTASVDTERNESDSEQSKEAWRVARVREALEKSDRVAFERAVTGTQFREMAEEPFFTELVRMYKLHVSGTHTDANAHLSRLLYDA